jgi:Transcription elongation factor, N-terminal
MRKGFTRKPKADESATPVKNYITPSGLERLKDEHRFLLTKERPVVTEVVAWAASNGDRSENADYQYGKRRLRQIDGRIRFLTKRIEAARSAHLEQPKNLNSQLVRVDFSLPCDKSPEWISMNPLMKSFRLVRDKNADAVLCRDACRENAKGTNHCRFGNLPQTENTTLFHSVNCCRAIVLSTYLWLRWSNS